MVETLFVGPLSTCCYIVTGDSDPDKVLLIDPGDDAPVIQRTLGRRTLCGILLTHGHFDHTGALSAFPGVPVYIGRKDLAMLNDPELSVGALCGDRRARPADTIPLDGGEALTFDGFKSPVRVIAVPGHTPGGMAYRIGSALFSGDTMFCHGCGRTDFPGGNEAKLHESLVKLLSLSGDPVVYPGHMQSTTLSEEQIFWGYGRET